MNNLMECIFNKNMRFEIDEHYDPKRMELLKKFERPLPELTDDEKTKKALNLMNLMIDAYKDDHERLDAFISRHPETKGFMEMLIERDVDLNEWIKEDY